MGGGATLKGSLVALLLSSLFFLSACSSDDGGSTPPPATTPAVNTAPTFTNDADVNVAENQLLALTLVATDEDRDTLVFSISGEDASLFELNATTGVVAFTTAPDFESGKISYSFSAFVSDGEDNATQDITLHIQNVAEQTPQLQNLVEELTTFTYSGDANWSESSDAFYSGDSSWASLDINDSQSSCMEYTTNETSEKQISFYAKVSSEGYYDKLKFYIDDAEQFSIGGDVNWTQEKYVLDAGEHQLKWCYSKDGSVSVDADKAWVDEIRLSTVYTTSEAKLSGESIGVIGLLGTDNAVSSFVLSGEGSEKFEVLNDGSIILSEKLDFETKESYELTLYATNSVGNSNTIALLIAVRDSDDLYINSAVYDDNRTATQEDDTLFVYFSKPIDESTLLATTDSNYILYGSGNIASDVLNDYNASAFNRHTIRLNAQSTLLVVDDTNISIRPNIITQSDGTYPLDETKSVVEAFRVMPKTGAVTCYDDRNSTASIDCNDTHALKSDGKYQKGERGYTDKGDGTLRDDATGLVWQQMDDDTQRSWEDAKTYCTDLSLGGSSEWYLPSIDELVSITDKGRVDPAIDPLFINTNSSGYWSSTTIASGPSGAWFVGFDGGYGYDDAKTDRYYVRCVR